MEEIIAKWEEILQTVKEEHDLSGVSFDTWLKPLSVFAVEDNTLYILVPHDKTTLNYIEKKFTLPLKVAVAEITGKDYNIEFVMPEQAKAIKTPKPKTLSTAENADKSGLNPNYTFDTFVVGSNNRLAHAASLAVAESPGEVYNPLYLYGGAGLGKTHLIHSIAHFIQGANPGLKILYVPTETFTNELIESIRNGNNTAMTKFREKYRNIDVLLIDDIQFIIGKESTQEEFFHTFNELYLAKKQIVISSDKPPKDMETLEERIRSRFEWGLIADIGSPDYETRMAILRRKEDMHDFHLDDEILNYIASNIKSNIRELEGAFNKLLALSNLEQTTDITMEVAVKELQKIIAPDKPIEITPNLIFDVVSEHFHYSKEQLISADRSSGIVRARQIAMYLCKNMTGISLGEIGTMLGGRDHSTIIHGIRKIEKDYKTDKASRELIDTIKKKMNPNL